MVMWLMEDLPHHLEFQQQARFKEQQTGKNSISGNSKFTLLKINQVAGKNWTSREFQRKRRNQRKTRKVLNGEIRTPSNEPYKKTTGCGDVALRRTEETLRVNKCEYVFKPCSLNTSQTFNFLSDGSLTLSSQKRSSLGK